MLRGTSRKAILRSPSAVVGRGTRYCPAERRKRAERRESTVATGPNLKKAALRENVAAKPRRLVDGAFLWTRHAAIHLRRRSTRDVDQPSRA